MDMGRYRHGSNHFVWSYLETSNPHHGRCCFGTLNTYTLKERHGMKKAQDIAGRIVAVFLSSALAIVGGSAVIAPELEIWKSAVLAGFAACATVVQKLAQASLDGKLTMEEINEAFGSKPKA